MSYKCVTFYIYIHLCIYQTLLSNATYSAFRLYIVLSVYYIISVI